VRGRQVQRQRKGVHGARQLSHPKTGNCDEPRKPDNAECETSGGDDGICTKGVCEPIDIGGGGASNSGAGGEDSAAGGVTGEGGAPTAGGEGNRPSASAGETFEPGTAGSSSGGTDNQGDAGSPEVPDHVFVRQPGGCSCRVPSSSGTSDLAWLAGAALAVTLVRRRRNREVA
jgi:MYXO-CTERM domain-containing protein